MALDYFEKIKSYIFELLQTQTRKQTKLLPHGSTSNMGFTIKSSITIYVTKSLTYPASLLLSRRLLLNRKECGFVYHYGCECGYGCSAWWYKVQQQLRGMSVWWEGWFRPQEFRILVFVWLKKAGVKVLDTFIDSTHRPLTQPYCHSGKEVPLWNQEVLVGVRRGSPRIPFQPLQTPLDKSWNMTY